MTFKGVSGGFSFEPMIELDPVAQLKLLRLSNELSLLHTVKPLFVNVSTRLLRDHVCIKLGSFLDPLVRPNLAHVVLERTPAGLIVKAPLWAAVLGALRGFGLCLGLSLGPDVCLEDLLLVVVERLHRVQERHLEGWVVCAGNRRDPGELKEVYDLLVPLLMINAPHDLLENMQRTLLQPFMLLPSQIASSFPQATNTLCLSKSWLSHE